MKHSESLSNIAPALLEAQKEIDVVPKDERRNNFGKRYTNLGTILRVAKEALRKQGMVILQTGEQSTVQGLLNMETVILHESGEYISGTISIPYGDSTPQKAGSAITYARRYSAASLLGMVSEEDDDGESASVPEKKDSKPSSPPAAKKPQPVTKPKITKPAAEKPVSEGRTSAELQTEAIKTIKTCEKSRKADPNRAVELDGRVESCVNYSKKMEKLKKMTEADLRVVLDFARNYFDA